MGRAMERNKVAEGTSEPEEGGRQGKWHLSDGPSGNILYTENWRSVSTQAANVHHILGKAEWGRAGLIIKGFGEII